MKKPMDLGSAIVIAITFVLFAIAPFIKGFTHDLLLEAGVFLVSVKLIMMASKQRTYISELKKESEEIKALIQQLQ